MVKTCPQVVCPVQKLSISCEMAEKKSKKISTDNFFEKDWIKNKSGSEMDYGEIIFITREQYFKGSWQYRGPSL